MDHVIQAGRNLFGWLVGDGAALGPRARAALAGVAAAVLAGVLVVVGVLDGSGGQNANWNGGNAAVTGQAPFTDSPASPSGVASSGGPALSHAGGPARRLAPVLGARGTLGLAITHAAAPVLAAGGGAVGARSAAASPSSPAPAAPRTAPGPGAGPVTPAVSAPPGGSAAPTGVSVVQGTGWIEVSWAAPPHPDSLLEAYDVFVATTPGGEGPIPVNGASLVFGTTYTVTHLPVGAIYYVTVRAFGGGGLSPASAEAEAPPVPAPPAWSTLAGPVVATAAMPNGSGYWLVDARGDVSAHGGAHSYGPAGGLQLTAPVVAMAATPDGLGYWEVTSDGQVHAFGDAASLGSVAGLPADDPIAAMAPTRDGRGYWLAAVDGAVFPFGDAQLLGSTGAGRVGARRGHGPGPGDRWLLVGHQRRRRSRVRRPLPGVDGRPAA